VICIHLALLLCIYMDHEIWELSKVSTAPSVFLLLCKAPMIASLDISGNIFVSSVISPSVGILTPAVVPSPRPAKPCTQSRTTPALRILEFVVPEGLAVVTTSSFWLPWVFCLELVLLLEISGKARLLRRGGRFKPRIGRRKRVDRLVTVGPIR